MSIYKTRLFGRWACKQGIQDSMLCQAVREIRRGLYEADLGGNLLKKRIARPGQGKSGGSGLSWQPARAVAGHEGG
jgi:hypothetical protein